MGACVALAYPDRVARARGPTGEDWIGAGGRGYRLDPASPLARAEWLAIAEAQGSAAAPRVLSAATLDPATVEALFAERIETVRHARFDPATGGVAAIRERRLGAIRLTRGPDDRADPAVIAAALVTGVRAHGIELLPWSDAAQAMRARIAFARAGGAMLPDVDDAALLATIDDWLPPLVAGRRRLDAIPAADLVGVIEGLLGWEGMRLLDRIAPAAFRTPAGSSHAIDYAAEGAPAIEVRVQALFGLATHPTVMEGRVPLLLRLTSPAGRPIQTTRDLPGFWQGSWAAVAKEMRGRYPRHPWPEDPAAADPTLRTKKSTARGDAGAA